MPCLQQPMHACLPCLSCFVPCHATAHGPSTHRHGRGSAWMAITVTRRHTPADRSSASGQMLINSQATQHDHRLLRTIHFSLHAVRVRCFVPTSRGIRGPSGPVLGQHITSPVAPSNIRQRVVVPDAPNDPNVHLASRNARATCDDLQMPVSPTARSCDLGLGLASHAMARVH